MMVDFGIMGPKYVEEQDGSFMFSLVYLFIHSVAHVTLDRSITDYNLYITIQLIIYGTI